ncbi:hypothetical protein A7D00_5857 [Trichophyton violaceum]|uniref:Uncharacterized protein n=1 Tax=Trichophyton violaceum TaxID=34388 RepID=A0A178FCF0_TRIVO|nr:hypothetical protein A7D00_5857 [Trichophyton violaceum]
MSYSDGATIPQGEASLSLLTGLPGGTRQIRYTNMKDLRAAVEECYKDDQNPFLVVVDVPPGILDDFDSEYLDKGPRITANLPERLLIIKTMAKPGHESVASDLIFYIRVGVLEMGLPDRLADTRSSRVTSKTGRFVKEPDGRLNLEEKLGHTDELLPIVEEVIATRKEDTTEVTGDMTLTFEEVVGRQRNEINERDVIITKADFREICQDAWAMQDFL